MAGNIPSKYYLSGLVFLILTRSFLVPVVWSNIITNWYYHLQILNANNLAGIIDRTNSLVLQRGNIMKSVQVQASLLSIRDAYSGLFIIGIILTLFILIFPFHSSPIRRVFDWKRKNATKEALQIPIS
jgi:hypothetical protein